jgi:hypothetical protein
VGKQIIIRSIAERDELARAIQAFDKKHGIKPHRSPKLSKAECRVRGTMSTTALLEI